MSGTPDPQLVREIAREAALRAARSGDYITEVISTHAAMAEILASGDRKAYGVLHAAARNEAKTVATVTWPDEQDTAADANPDYTPAMRIRRTLHEVNGDLRTSDPDLFAAGVRFVVEIACRECKTETRWTAGDVVACPACSAHAAGLYCGDRACGPCSFDRVSDRFGVRP